MASECLYCRLHFSDTIKFCPNCGRPTESGFRIRPMPESELDHLRRELKEKEDLIRQLVLVQTTGGQVSYHAAARMVDGVSKAAMGGGRGQWRSPLAGVEGSGLLGRGVIR